MSYNDNRYKTPDLPHLFDQGGGAWMVEFWNPRAGKWVNAQLCYSTSEAKHWLDYQGYPDALWLPQTA